MFIYLDHAQIAALDVLQQRNPKGFGEFLAFWLEHRCQLILSRAHLHEIGQSEDELDVIRRPKLSKRKEPKWDPEAWKMMPVARTVLPDLRGDAVGECWLREVEGGTQERWSRAKPKRQMLACIVPASAVRPSRIFPGSDSIGRLRTSGSHPTAGAPGTTRRR
jgi:hypothetical protein